MHKTKVYDAFLSHSHNDAEVVEIIANRLEDDHNLKVWLDKWILIPGKPFRRELSKGLDQAQTCVIILGDNTPKGWFEEEVSKALNKQTQDKSFRVIPLLLPSSDSSFVKDFLELRTWVRFKNHINESRPFHEMVCGIKGIPPGRKFSNSHHNQNPSKFEQDLKRVKRLYDENLIDETVKIEFQKSLVQKILKSVRNEL